MPAKASSGSPSLLRRFSCSASENRLRACLKTLRSMRRPNQIVASNARGFCGCPAGTISPTLRRCSTASAMHIVVQGTVAAMPRFRHYLKVCAPDKDFEDKVRTLGVWMAPSLRCDFLTFCIAKSSAVGCPACRCNPFVAAGLSLEATRFASIWRCHGQAAENL